MKYFKISDDSGFIGIANFDKYQAYIGEELDFELVKDRIIQEINSHNLLFWATGLENIWKVKIDDKPSNMEAFREERGVIEVSDGKLYLTNYESLTMAGQYEDLKLPEDHLKHLFVELENGKYMIKFRQIFDPENYDFNSQEVDFELIILEIKNHPYLYKNKVSEIYWASN